MVALLTKFGGKWNGNRVRKERYLGEFWTSVKQVVAPLTVGLLPSVRRRQKYISQHEVFMYDYYRKQLPFLPRLLFRSERLLIKHYLLIGARAGYNPHHLFETNWYLEKYRDVASGSINPLEHYLRHGSAENRSPSPFVEVTWYFAKMGVPGTQMNTLMLYRLARAGGSQQSPTPFFDRQCYLDNGPDLREVPDLFEHFICFGRFEDRKPNPYFDSGWYLSTYEDVAKAKRGASDHYVLDGSDENRDPSMLFSTSYYRARCLKRGLTPFLPLAHYLSTGRDSGMQPYDAGTLPAKARIAVIVHLYYRDLWPEIARYLASIPKPFDLYISIPKQDSELASFLARRYPKATVLEVDNEGHDIAPFFAFLEMIFKANLSYTAICKIHTKKGTTHPSFWRRLLLQSTLRNKFLVAEIVRSFIADENLYLAGAAELFISGWEFVGSNGRQVAEMCVELYPGRPFPSRWGYLAGSMFWVKPDVLRPLTALVSRRRAAFGENTRESDGQFSHALERMLGYVATFEDKKIALVRSSGPGPHDFRLDRVSAAIGASNEQPHLMLGRIAQQYPSWASAEVGPNERRVWQPDRDARPGVHFVGPITYLNGLGTSARNYCSAIVDLPLNASAEPWAWGFDRLKQCNYDFPSGTDQPIHIIHLNLDLLYSLSVNDPKRFADLFRADRYFVLICYFELVSLLPEWIPILKGFDEVWCASGFMGRAISAVSKVKVRVVRPPLQLRTGSVPAVRRGRFGLDDDRFVFAYFLDAGSVVGRKNPEALLNAYCEAFEPDDGACCFLKIHYGDPAALLPKDLMLKVSGRSDIIISNEIYPASELPSLFDAIDCYVSPHRSEGLGLTIVEAMSAAKPTIATPYGGAADFVNEATAFPIAYRWTEVGEGNSPYPANHIWADPDVNSLASTMLNVFRDQDAAREKGRAGQRFIREIFGNETTTAGVREALSDIWRAGGFSASRFDLEHKRRDH